MSDYCPTCGVALATGVSHCADCGEELIKPIQVNRLAALTARIAELEEEKGESQLVIELCASRVLSAKSETEKWKQMWTNDLRKSNARIAELVEALKNAVDMIKDVVNGRYEYGDPRYPAGIDVLARAKGEVTEEPKCPSKD